MAVLSNYPFGQRGSNVVSQESKGARSESLNAASTAGGYAPKIPSSLVLRDESRRTYCCRWREKGCLVLSWKHKNCLARKLVDQRY